MFEYVESRNNNIKGYDRCDNFSTNDDSLIVAEYMSDKTDNTVPILTLCSAIMSWDTNTNMSTLNVYSCGGYSSFNRLDDFYNVLSNHPYGVTKDELIKKLDELGYKDMTLE